jgi:hypothetical protein
MNEATVQFSVNLLGRVQTWQFVLSEKELARFIDGKSQMVFIRLQDSFKAGS